MRVNSHYLFHAYPVSDGIGEATGEDQLILDHAFFFHGMQGIPRSSRTVRICTTENLSLILTSFASRRSLVVQMPNPRSRLVNRGPMPHTSTTGRRASRFSVVCAGARSHTHTPPSSLMCLAVLFAIFASVLNHGLLHQMQLDTYPLMTNRACLRYEALAAPA